MKKLYFQALYIFTFLICLLGIAGNIEQGIKTPVGGIVLTCITGFLSVGKVVYEIIDERRA